MRLRENIRELELSEQKLELERNMLFEDIERRYGEEIQAPTKSDMEKIVAQSKEDLDSRQKELKESIQTLGRKLEREGEVDPSAIAEYEQESERLEEMKSQYQDLENAAQLLDQTIARLKKISKNRFLETFSDVSRRFAELLPRLFGGGSGRMELINPEDPLLSGVEMVVRPPGKTLKTMDLLSGGEKALAATAVLMAVFLHKPAPICVLDEVDAPLDDANLERFLNLITENRDKAQFLLITHNKMSMNSVDKLIGITMEEKGVSSAYSISLEQAEQQIEQWVANA